jgi:hypothetical protein
MNEVVTVWMVVKAVLLVGGLVAVFVVIMMILASMAGHWDH